jgi:hypothetical protein
LVVGSKVERAYRRGDMFEKRRRLMQQWAIFCTPAPGAEQPRADAADGLTSNRSFTEGSNMSDETKPAPLWERTKAWADKNRTISGALVGGAAGTIVPGLGTVIGAIVGAGVGFASSKEKKDDRPS